MDSWYLLSTTYISASSPRHRWNPVPVFLVLLLYLAIFSILHPPSLLFSRTEKVLVLSKSVVPEVNFLYCFPPFTAACCCFTNIHFIKSCDKVVLDTRKMLTKLMDSPSQFQGAWMGDHWPSHCDQQSLFYFENELLNTPFVKLFLSCWSGAQGPALCYSKPTGVFLFSAVFMTLQFCGTSDSNSCKSSRFF